MGKKIEHYRYRIQECNLELKRHREIPKGGNEFWASTKSAML
jgi:hypothetical protein